MSTTGLLERYKVTKPTLFKRRDALVESGFISPIREAGRVLYSPEDVYYLDCFHYWASLGFTVKEVTSYLNGLERGYWTGRVTRQVQSPRIVAAQSFLGPV